MSGNTDGFLSTTRHVNTLNFRKELLKEDEVTLGKRDTCPTAGIQLENLNLTALADGGSQVSCLSEKFYQDNLDTFKDCPCLPINRVCMMAAAENTRMEERIKEAEISKCRTEIEQKNNKFCVTQIEKSIFL